MTPGPGGEAATTPLFTFDTTQHALWAEEVAGERGIPCEVVPAPPEVEAKCDLAIRTTDQGAVELAKALREEGVVFQLLGK